MNKLDHIFRTVPASILTAVLSTGAQIGVNVHAAMKDTKVPGDINGPWSASNAIATLGGYMDAKKREQLAMLTEAERDAAKYAQLQEQAEHISEITKYINTLHSLLKLRYPSDDNLLKMQTILFDLQRILKNSNSKDISSVEDLYENKVKFIMQLRRLIVVYQKIFEQFAQSKPELKGLSKGATFVPKQMYEELVNQINEAVDIIRYTNSSRR